MEDDIYEFGYKTPYYMKDIKEGLEILEKEFGISFKERILLSPLHFNDNKKDAMITTVLKQRFDLKGLPDNIKSRIKEIFIPIP